MDFLMQLDSLVLIDLIGKAKEKEFEETFWERWLAELPLMHQGGKVTSFTDYLDKHREKRQQSKKSDKEVIEDAENILKSMSKT